jgi:hypothetical protein
MKNYLRKAYAFRLIIVICCLFNCPGCTLIGLFVGGNAAYLETDVEKLESGDNIKVYLNNGMEQKGEFVYYESDTLHIEVDKTLFLTDTLALPLYRIQNIKKNNLIIPIVGALVGFIIDYNIYKSMMSFNIY